MHHEQGGFVGHPLIGRRLLGPKSQVDKHRSIIFDMRVLWTAFAVVKCPSSAESYRAKEM